MTPVHTEALIEAAVPHPTFPAEYLRLTINILIYEKSGNPG